MTNLKELFDRVNELEQIIDLETEHAEEGCIRSRQLVINAQAEKEEIDGLIAHLGISNCLV
jgi:predicted NACHT family NTPase